MKDFFKFTFASMLGFFLMILLFLFVSFVLMISIISASSSDDVTIYDQSILHLKFNKPISERTPTMPENIFDFESFKIEPGLNDILKNLERAKTDDRIRGIYLDLAEVPSGISTLSEIRDALLDFKTSGKFIIAYAEIFTQKGYYLGSVADKIYLHPEGQMVFKGLMAQPLFFKDALDHLGIEAQVIRHGEYKSAVEPFIMNEMSDENREQINKYVMDIWNSFTESISQSRGIDKKQLNDIADELKADAAEDALQLGLVDSLLYFDEVREVLAQAVGADQLMKKSMLSLYKYNKDKSLLRKMGTDRIAVIYATGSIMSGQGNNDNIYSRDLTGTLRKARMDDNIDAVILRVNSPGGDALASDVILREVKLLSEQKPIVVSMSDVAASGGYYIACGADYIYANEMTLTGSIGVFGIIPNIDELLNEKLGVHADEVKTNKNADYIDIVKPMPEFQKLVLTNQIEKIYATFLDHVAEGRMMDVDEVDAIGGGRVWAGRTAIEIGLVDEIGGLNDAIQKAGELAGIEEYRILEWPEQLEPFQEIMRDLSGEASTSLLKHQLGDYYSYVESLNNLKSMQGVQARLPFVISLN